MEGYVIVRDGRRISRVLYTYTEACDVCGRRCDREECDIVPVAQMLEKVA